MPAIERRIVRLDERIPRPRPGCAICRTYPDRRYCDELTCTHPSVCRSCGREIFYRVERRYRGVALSDI